MADVRIEDHSDEYMDATEKALVKALTEIGIHLEGEAKQNLNRPMPHKTGDPLNRPYIDTGLLWNSITYALDGEAPNITEYKAKKGDGSGHYDGTAPKEWGRNHSVIIGTNVEYAEYIHDGTSRITPNRFLKDAVDQNKEQIKQWIENAMS